jgi:hypothetical protein
MQHVYFGTALVLSLLHGLPCIYQSQIELSNDGYRFQPVNNDAQLLSSFISEVNLFQSCSIACNKHLLCRVFDIHGEVLNQCRLFQGNMPAHGSVVPSSVLNARVGGIQYLNNQFFNYGQSCSSQPSETRYLVCGINGTWECPPNTYWNPTEGVCRAKSPFLGSICQQNLDMCRQDLNYTCLQFNQCGRT